MDKKASITMRLVQEERLKTLRDLIELKIQELNRLRGEYATIESDILFNRDSVSLLEKIKEDE